MRFESNPYKRIMSLLTQNLRTIGLIVFIIICYYIFLFLFNLRLKLVVEFLTHTLNFCIVNDDL